MAEYARKTTASLITFDESTFIVFVKKIKQNVLLLLRVVTQPYEK